MFGISLGPWWGPVAVVLVNPLITNIQSVTKFLLFTISVIGLASSVGCQGAAFTIDPEEVTAISATILNHPGQGTNIEEFEVPASLHKDLLDLLNGAKAHHSQIDWAVLGQLKITTQEGVQEVWVFSAGKKFIFDFGGKYEANNLEMFIRTIEDAKKMREKK